MLLTLVIFNNFFFGQRLFGIFGGHVVAKFRCPRVGYNIYLTNIEIDRRWACLTLIVVVEELMLIINTNNSRAQFAQMRIEYRWMPAQLRWQTSHELLTWYAAAFKRRVTWSLQTVLSSYRLTHRTNSAQGALKHAWHQCNQWELKPHTANFFPGSNCLRSNTHVEWTQDIETLKIWKPNLYCNRQSKLYPNCKCKKITE